MTNVEAKWLRMLVYILMPPSRVGPKNLEEAPKADRVRHVRGGSACGGAELVRVYVRLENVVEQSWKAKKVGESVR